MAFTSVTAAPPTRRHLRHWEQVCCFLDSQPRRAVAHPFPIGPEVPLLSTRLLKRLAAHKLVRHYDDCTWRLDRRWRARLARLAEGLPADDARETRTPDDEMPAPFIADTGVDTLYVSLFGEALPLPLLAACDTYKAQAQEDETSVETDWRCFDAPLSLLKHGVGTSAGGTVSWSFILRNEYVQLLLRRTPLQGLIGSVRFSAKCLWTYGARDALDQFRADLGAVWLRVGRESLEHVRWQVSQIHLCADVANFSPSPADLARVVTRSVKKAVHVPSLLDASLPDPALFGASDEWDDLDSFLAAETYDPYEALVPPEWAGVPLEDEDTEDDDDGSDDDGQADQGDGSDASSDEAPADEEGAVAYLWGQRASGFSFSPGGALSAAWYDKLLEERLSGKLWMRPIHAAGGWHLGMPLLRVEARFRREALRDLTSAYAPSHSQGAPGVQEAHDVPRWCDDPWDCLHHLNDLWGYFAGLPPEHDTAPDVLGRGWLRLTLPIADDTNHSRWPTDPTWETIQRAQFTPAAPGALKRQPQVSHDLEQVDAEVYGLLKLRSALRGEYLDTTATLTLEVRRFIERMDEVDAMKGRDYAEEVREKARSMGKPVPMRTDTVLPMRGSAA